MFPKGFKSFYDVLDFSVVFRDILKGSESFSKVSDSFEMFAGILGCSMAF